MSQSAAIAGLPARSSRIVRNRAFVRGWLYLVALAIWAVILLWSRPWLDRFAYGPLEWVWRSLVRWRPQPMRRAVRMTIAN